MDKDMLQRGLDECFEKNEYTDRIQKAVDRFRGVNSRKIEAYKTLLELYADPDAEAPALSVLESLLGVSADDAEEEDGDKATALRPPVVDPVGDSGSARVSEEDLARFSDCQSIMDIADKFAALGDGTVYIARVTDIAQAKKFGNPRAKHPRKQIWLRVYSELKKANSYVYDGRGTGRFTRQSHPVQSAPLVSDC